MSPTQAKGLVSSKSNLDSPTYELPAFPNCPKVIQMGLYTWKLEPSREGFMRNIILDCIQCNYLAKSKLSSIDSTNLKSHRKNKHEGALRVLQEHAKASNLPGGETLLSSNIFYSLDTSTPRIDSYFTHGSASSDSSGAIPSSILGPRVATRALFEPSVYKTFFFF